MRSNIPDYFNRRFGFKTTREERLKNSMIYTELSEFKTAQERIDYLEKEKQERRLAEKDRKKTGLNLGTKGSRFVSRLVKHLRKEQRRLRVLHFPLPDYFNTKFGFKTTIEERSRFSSLYGTLVYVCKTHEQRLYVLRADLEEHSFRNQRYKDLGVETDMQLVAMKFYKRFIKTMEKRRLRSLAVLDEFEKIEKN